jgi:hypothetical protein
MRVGVRGNIEKTYLYVFSIFPPTQQYKGGVGENIEKTYKYVLSIFPLTPTLI